MSEPSVMSSALDRPLPDPRAELPLSAHGALRAADQAAWQARRLLAASRAILTGNLAMALCLPATGMVWLDAARGDPTSDLVVLLVEIGFVTWAATSLYWRWRLRSTGQAHAVAPVEAALQAACKRPVRRLAAGFALVYGLLLLGSVVIWNYLFKVMPAWGINIAIALSVAAIPGLFVVRFVKYLFWEDLLFTVCVAAAYGLWFFRAPPELALLAVLPPLGVIVATICLHERWRSWLRSLPPSAPAPTIPEDRS